MEFKRISPFLMTGALFLFGLTSCNDKNDDYDEVGRSTVVSLDGPSTAFMGDSLSFSFKIADDGNIQLNTSKIQVVYGEEIVSERIMVTPKSGEYSGKVLLPFIKDVNDGDVTIQLRIQNERFANDVKTKEISINRPIFPYLTLKSADLGDIQMSPVTGQPHLYSVSGNFPSEFRAYIEAPKYGENGNKMTFGNVDGKITNGVTSFIEFTADTEDGYELTFNTHTFVGTPFIKFAVNDIEFEKVNDNEHKVEMEFTQGQEIEITGLKDDYVNYWIDPSFFKIKRGTDKKVLIFRAMTDKYRFTVNKSLKYFMIEPMIGSALSTFNTTTAEGAIWCIGDGNVGRPSYSANGVNWTENRAFALAPLGDKKHLLVLEAGKNIHVTNVNYKFFAQKGWGWEFTQPRISFADDNPWFTIPASDGNIRKGSVSRLTAGKFYHILVDVSAGPTSAKITVTEEDEIEEIN